MEKRTRKVAVTYGIRSRPSETNLLMHDGIYIDCSNVTCEGIVAVPQFRGQAFIFVYLILRFRTQKQRIEAKNKPKK